MFIHDLIRQGAPDAMAIIDHQRRFTYKDFQDAVDACRNRLYAAGVRQGDRVGIFSRNSAEFVFAFMGTASLGAIAVPINFQLSSREIAYIVKDAGIETILTYQPLNLADAMAQLRCDLKVAQIDIRNIGKPKTGIAEAPKLSDYFSEDNPCEIIYTSGTTGNPKGAVLSHRNIVANTQQMSFMGCKAEHNVLCVLPMYHVFGLTCSVFYPFSVGATVAILDSFTPKETIATIRDEKITDLYIVPSICSLLTKLASEEDMKTVRLVVSGGTTLPLKIQQDFIGKFGVDICEGYGLSETSPVVTMNPPQKAKVGSCGPIVPGLKWKLIDDAGNEVAPGEPGELVVKGDNVMLGYWNLPDVTHDAMRGGWFHTGDVARVDDEGYIYIVDRIKDMIISMGENIYPREVEELIYQFPGVYEAAVVGIEDKLRGQAGACFYSVHEGADVNVRALKKFLQANLALYKIPREFHQLDKLPRTTTGKIAKKDILKQFQEGKIK
ncbi:long-chain fatty acid--CoA ligase [Selenomonas caprae]|uniref:Long-chain acyl-CoA synthetase n=2 Tax=Selenomonas TaxID=970 RepID=A0A1I3GPL9_SELRU|nr:MULTISPECIES: AMP-binding protein [Selenomonas]MBQ1889352.1 AMP-binding protein [Selenomonas sp.]TYZ28577.1 long-chain fatty acid--CoA ligase [Selenomonas caprae]SFI25343.1 long-chain acyl-CoA synthetase [Selenomonas ruminantium]